MKFFEKLIKKEILFQRIIGMSFEQFISLTAKIRPLWEDAEVKRLERIDRVRGIGAGHPYALRTMEQKLLAVLMYYKTYPTQELLGLILGIDQSAVSRLITRMMPLIEKAADPQLKDLLAMAKQAIPNEKIKNFDELIKRFPELRDVATDTTEQLCYRSVNYEQQKKYYSGKSKQHAIKTQISVSCCGKILDVSKSYPGSYHDKSIVDQEKTIEKFSKLVPHRFDSGYQGLRSQYSEHYLILPIKKRKGMELSKVEKELNTANSKRRVIVEHIISRLKKFKILSGLFRNQVGSYNQAFRGVSAILNFRLENIIFAV